VDWLGESFADQKSRAIAEYLARWQPPSLMLWGRQDAFFDLAEILSWMRALPRMEAHVLDAGHFLFETHADAAVSLILDFINNEYASSLPSTDQQASI
jgi:pimeloyl-ACP methyl ester carboxylesterase